ncbi:MAG: hypothetical protein WBO13_06610 [Vibrio fluvialis]
MINKPTFFPLEYCSIERAAKMFGCEIEDIQHWLTIGAMKGYVKAKSLETDDGNFECVVYECAQFFREREGKSVELDSQGKVDQISYQTSDDATVFSSLCFTYRLDNVDYYSSKPSRGFLSEIDDDLILGVGDARVRGHILFHGFVEIFSIEDFEKIFSQEGNGDPITLISMAEPDDMSFPVEYYGVIHPDDIYIFREDLLRVFNSIRDNPERPLTIVGNCATRDEANKKARLSQKHVNVIQAAARTLLNIGTNDQPYKHADAFIEAIKAGFDNPEDIPDIKTIARYLGAKS